MQGNSDSTNPSISADGQIVAFESWATNLVAGDMNYYYLDVFAHDRCDITASWSNYGAGFPGTLGVPTLTAATNPVIGSTLTVDVGNSATTATIAAILVGDTQASIPMRKGGNLLLTPLLTIVLPLPPGGTSVDAEIENDPSLCGAEFFAQTLVADAGAAKGQSASAGLKLVLGY